MWRDDWDCIWEDHPDQKLAVLTEIDVSAFLSPTLKPRGWVFEVPSGISLRSTLN